MSLTLSIEARTWASGIGWSGTLSCLFRITPKKQIQQRRQIREFLRKGDTLVAATNKRRLWLIWGTIGAIILIAILFIALVDFDQVLRQLGRVNWQYLLLGSVLLLVGYLFYAIRWRSLLPQGIKLFDVFHAGNSGQMVNTWIPSRLGILVRTTMISQEYELPFVKVMSSVVIERWFETVMRLIALIGTVMLLTSRDFSIWTVVILLAIIGLSWGLLVGISRYQTTILEKWPRKLAGLPGLDQEKAERLLSGLLIGLVGIGSTRRLTIAFVWSVVMWALFLGYHYGGLVALNVRFKSTEMLGLALGSLAIAPPSTATKPIIYQGIIVFVLGLFGFDTATLTAYAILLHLPQLIWITGLGLWGFFKGPKIKLKRLMAEVESETNSELSEAAPKPTRNESTKRKI